jgi:hypothetical protein
MTPVLPSQAEAASRGSPGACTYPALPAAAPQDQAPARPRESLTAASNPDTSHRHGAAADENIASQTAATPASASPVPLQPPAIGILSAVQHSLASSSIRADCRSMTSSARASSSSADVSPADDATAPPAPARTPAAAATNHSKHCRHRQIAYPARRVAAVGRVSLRSHRHSTSEYLRSRNVTNWILFISHR